MKKLIYTLAILAAASTSVLAQFTITPKVHNMSGANTELVEGLSSITNNTADAADSMFSWTVIEYALPTGWASSFCDPNLCYYNLNVSTSYQFKLKKGAVDILRGDFDFEGVNGQGAMKVVVKSMLNPSITDTIAYTGNAWTTGLYESSKAQTFSFYPNPVKSQLTVKYATREPLNVEIYNVLGTKVRSFSYSGTSGQVNIADLQNGVYFIRFTDNGKLFTKQFTKSE
jgi:hypothetical protein